MSSPSSSKIPMRALLAGARRKQRSLIALIRQLVSSESPSDSKPAVDACLALAAAHAPSPRRTRQNPPQFELRQCPRSPLRPAQLNFKAYPPPRSPRHSLAARNASIHALQDQWWPPLGPGTLDMKAGVAMAFTALELLTSSVRLLRSVFLWCTSFIVLLITALTSSRSNRPPATRCATGDRRSMTRTRPISSASTATNARSASTSRRKAAAPC